MTYKEAKAAGWKDGDYRYTKGYYSRKNYDMEKEYVHTAQGNRNGQLYILMPSYQSTRYMIRHYLTKDASNVVDWRMGKDRVKR